MNRAYPSQPVYVSDDDVTLSNCGTSLRQSRSIDGLQITSCNIFQALFAIISRLSAGVGKSAGLVW